MYAIQLYFSLVTNIFFIVTVVHTATPLSPAPTDSSSEGETALRAEPTRKDIEVEKVSNGLKLSDKVVWGSIIGKRLYLS